MRDTETSVETLLDQATEALRDAAGKQAKDRDAAHEDFYRWGWALSELTGTVEEVARMLGRQVSAYGDRRVLRDDEGGDPYARLAAARAHLDEAGAALSAANMSVRAYHSAVGHIAVEVDPDAAADEDER